MKGSKIRQLFIDYFKSKGHTHVRSSSLVPDNDPTLLFVNSGMVQFKRLFIGEEKREYKRATTYQKSVRAGGKHNDLENVGYTARHHTFFEMLGNFSFGDYFKEDAISYAWELLTEGYKLPKDKLWVSVFYDDDEAFKIWNEKVGVPKDKIVKLGEEDNFWAMGDIGPCGPCSEIYFDRGEAFGCGSKNCQVGCDCDRYVEIWNLVFMQFEQKEDGTRSNLPKPSIDTGMGLERMAAVLQDVKNNYETDFFLPIISFIEQISGTKYGDNNETDIAIKVIADHARSSTFLICDGVLPSNEGRGYVLRRIIRRAVRYGRQLGLKESFIAKTSKVVIEHMKDAYPELADSEKFISNVIENEEERFFLTLDKGLKILNEVLEEIKEKDKKEIKGDVIFKLYDSYGFPVDIIQDLTKNTDIYLDLDSFNKKMEEQRKRSKSSVSFDGLGEVYKDLASKGIKTNFVGYDSLECESKILLIVDKDGKEIESATKGKQVSIVTEDTPLYGESGGQRGDLGIIVGQSGKCEIINTIKDPVGLIVHQGKLLSGNIKKGEKVSLLVDKASREKIAKNHTATHILHAALRKILGDHVKQAGSFLDINSFRFDFTHFLQIDKKTIWEIENYVNEKICENVPITSKIMQSEEAFKTGAMAIFEEKYGDFVRVISLGDFSKEFCGGTHSKRTGDIGFFKIISEASVASGVRRIEALTGKAALKYIQNREKIIKDIEKTLQSKPEELNNKVKKMIEAQKELEKKINKIKSKSIFSSADETIKTDLKEINKIKVFAKEFEVDDIKQLRDLADHIKNKIGSGIIVLGAKFDDKAQLIVSVTKDLTDKFDANKIIKEIAKEIGGTGGGRKDMAQAGGAKASNLKNALQKVFSII